MTTHKEPTNDLTIEQLQRIIANHESGVQLTGVAVYRQLLATMQREAKLREALQYIVDHNWVAGATPVKWINEFVDVAKVALESGNMPATGKEGV